MNWLYLLLGFLIGIIVLYLGCLIYGFICAVISSKNELFCNDCEISYVMDKEYKYCPFCGKKLTYHRDNPLYNPIINNKEIGLERPNNIESDDSNNDE